MTNGLGVCREASLPSRRDSFPNLGLLVSAHSEGGRQVPGAWFQLWPTSLQSFAPASVWPPRRLYLWGRPPCSDSRTRGSPDAEKYISHRRAELVGRQEC